MEKTSALPDGLLQPFIRSNFDTQEQRGVPYLDSLSIGGPFPEASPGDTPSRRRIFACRPSNSSEEPACAQKILTALVRKAYRRPITDADLEAPLRFYKIGSDSATSKNRLDAGIENALLLILTSPEFLFRVESDSGGDTRSPFRRVSDMDLATRLSFFLWSSIPDDELIDIAARGTLHDPVVLEKQVRRMLADERSWALVTNFAAQWLYLRNLR